MTRTGPRATAPLRVGRVEPYDADGWSGVRAEVDGAEIRFETDGAPLAPAPEAFASAILVAALEARRPIALVEPVDRDWLRGATELIRAFSEWWGYREIAIHADARDADRARTAAETGLCFSGGADSFHALLRFPERIDAIATVQGFDIPLADEARWGALSSSLVEIAKARGVRSLRIRTNLREHPAMRGRDWERCHGGALAAVGHLTSTSIGRLVIASSIPAGDPTPWGSHWQTDALWSSSTLTVVPWGHESRRDQKIRDICREPLVERHLRVCWENRAATGNCSRCVKCMRTALVLLDEGVLDRYAGFARAAQLPALLDAIPTARRPWRVFEELLRKRSLPVDVHRALESLVRRTHRSRTPLGRLLRWMRRRR